MGFTCCEQRKHETMDNYMITHECIIFIVVCLSRLLVVFPLQSCKSRCKHSGKDLVETRVKVLTTSGCTDRGPKL